MWGREPGPVGTLAQRAGGGCMSGQMVWGPGMPVPLIPVVRVRRGIFGENGAIDPRSRSSGPGAQRPSDYPAPGVLTTLPPNAAVSYLETLLHVRVKVLRGAEDGC